MNKKQVKFHFTLYDKDGIIEEENDYYSLTDIHRDYDQIPYATLYYILHYGHGGKNNEKDIVRKPRKTINEIMKRIKIEHIINNDLFKKKSKE